MDTIENERSRNIYITNKQGFNVNVLSELAQAILIQIEFCVIYCCANQT